MTLLGKLLRRASPRGAGTTDLSDPSLRHFTDRIERHFRLLSGGDGAAALPMDRMSNALILYAVDFVFQATAQRGDGGIEKAFPVAAHLLARMSGEPAENWAPRIVDTLMIRDKLFKQFEAAMDDPEAVRALTEATPLPILLASRAAATHFVAHCDGGDVTPSGEDIAAYTAICFPPGPRDIGSGT